MGKYNKDLHSWGSLANRDFVTPDLFNSGYQEDGSPGVQQVAYNLVGDADGNSFFLLSGFVITHDSGNDYDIGEGTSFLSGTIKYNTGQISKPLGMDAGYIYLKHNQDIVSSANMDVNGCLIGEFDNGSITDTYNRRIEKDSLWVEYNSEHQYFHGQVEIDKTVTMNQTGFVAGDWNVTGELNVDGYTTIDDETYISSNLHVGGTGQIDGSRLHLAGDLIVSGAIGLTDASTITHGTAQLTFNTDSLLLSGATMTGLANTQFTKNVDIDGTLNVDGESTLNAILMGSADKIRWINDEQYISATDTVMTIDGDDDVDILADTQIDLSAPTTVVSDILTVGTSLSVPSITSNLTYNGTTMAFKTTSSSIETNKVISVNNYNGITIAMTTSAGTFGQTINHAGALSNGDTSGSFIGLFVATNKVLVFGTIRKTAWSFTPGLPVYVDDVAGDLTHTSTGITYVTPVGIALTVDTLFISPSFVVVE